MIDLDNQTNLSIALSALEEIALTLSTQVIELIIVDEDTMKTLNRKHRAKDVSTDVLSFPIDSAIDSKSMPLGSIVIAASYVIKKAAEYEHSIQDELSLLFIHGILHLLGYDHETDSGEMRQKEKDLIQKFHLPKSLIIRTDY